MRSADSPTSACARRGFALLAVLWAVMLAGLVLVGVQHATRVNLATGHNELAGVQAHWLARAGIEQAMAELALDNAGVDSSLDYWYEDSLNFENVKLGSGTYSVVSPRLDDSGDSRPRYGLEDMAARVNINAADEKQLAALEMLSEAHVSAILDWRSNADSARPGGAGVGYYQGLDFPYMIRNAPFQTLHELRLVRDIDNEIFFGRRTNPDAIHYVTEERGLPVVGDIDDAYDMGLWRTTTIYSYDHNKTATGADRVNMNEADAQSMRSSLNLTAALAAGVEQQRGQKKFESVFDLISVQPQQQQQQGGRGSRNGNSNGNGNGEDAEGAINAFSIQWLADNFDLITIRGDEPLPGLININTAPRVVLLTLPGIERETVDAIINFREGSSGPFRSVGDLLSGAKISEDAFKAIAERVTVRSSVFQITSVGTSAHGVRRHIVAVVDRGAEPMRVLYWYQSP